MRQLNDDRCHNTRFSTSTTFVLRTLKDIGVFFPAEWHICWATHGWVLEYFDVSMPSIVDGCGGNGIAEKREQRRMADWSVRFSLRAHVVPPSKSLCFRLHTRRAEMYVNTSVVFDTRLVGATCYGLFFKHNILNMTDKKHPNIFPKHTMLTLNCFCVRQGGRNENHHFVVVTQVDDRRRHGTSDLQHFVSRQLPDS